MSILQNISFSRNSRGKRRLAAATRILRKSPLLDQAWYRRTYLDLGDAQIDAVLHYLKFGADEGRNPHPLFDTKFYIEQNPDVAASGMNPLVHFLLHGGREFRDPHPLFSSAWYKTQYRQGAENPLVHYVTKGRHAGLDPHPLFMSAFYRTAFPQIEAINIEPLAHYLESGAANGLNPNPLFDSAWYLDSYPDVASQGINPLVHYRLKGVSEGRNPSPYFDTAEYLKRNRDVAASKSQTALGHYLRYGATEGRSTGVIEPIDDISFVAARDDDISHSTRSRLPAPTQASLHLTTYLDWCRLNDAGAGILALQRRQAVALAWKPIISLIVPVYKVPVSLIRELVDSIKAQSYGRWQICVALAWFEDEELTRYLKEEAANEPRIKLVILEKNEGISGNSNAALQLVEGEYIGLLDHDDTLPPNALFEMAKALNQDPSIDFLYSDKDTMDESGANRFNPLFKPAWSPELMLSINYLTHFNVMRASRVHAIGGWNKSTDGAQDWDLFLRFIDANTKVHAVRRPLYHWRVLPTSVASGLGAKPWAAEAQLRAVSHYLEHNGWRGAVATFAAKNMIQVKWSDSYRPSIFILVVGETEIAEGDGWTAARRTEREANSKISIKYLSINGRNFGDLANEAVAGADAGIVVILDAACKPVGGWVTELVGPLQNDALAAVGGRLENSTGTLVEAGWTFPGGRPTPLFGGLVSDYDGVFAGAWCCRNHLAVSGSFMAVNRRIWDAVGGLSNDPEWKRHDLDLGIRISARSLGRIMLNAYARASTNQKSVFASNADISTGTSSLFSRYFPDGDPFFHPSLAIEGVGRPVLRQASAVRPPDFFIEARHCATEYDAPPSAFNTIASETKSAIRSIAWFVPNFEVAFYGGIHTILRAADYMRSHHGMQTTIVAIGAQDVQALKLTISRAFPELAESCDIRVIPNIQIPSAFIDVDAAVATLWVTAYAIIRLRNIKHRFYFIQDYEPLFYPAGSTYSLAEATYRFGFHGICNTYPLQQLYEQHGGTADHFLPAVDSSVFHARGRVRRDSKEPFLLFNYARPAHPRNCFEVVAEGLVELKRRMKDRLRIITAGAEWDPKDYGLLGVVEHLGLLPYRETGELYRSVDAGIVAMATSHPSYLPFELMASGAVVFTNFNQHTQWLLKDQENCVLFNLTRSSIADALENSLSDAERLEKIAARGLLTIAEEYDDWRRPCAAIASAILREAKGKRERHAS